MEERVARIEADAAHIQSDVGEIKTAIRRLDDKIDDSTRRLDDKIDDSTRRLDDKIDDSVRRLEGKIDDSVRRLEGKIDDSARRLDGKIESVKDMVSSLALSTEKSFSSLIRWGIGLYITLLAALGTGFMWVVQRL